jgi:hypothetical protein
VPDSKRTRFAQAAADFAGLFEFTFEEVRIVGSCPRKPVLKVPEGESTGGGAAAVQHIVLEPDVRGHRAITVGWVNKANQTALVRTHGCLMQMHRQAFGDGKLGLDPAAYQHFLEQLRELCASHSIDLRLQTTPAPAPRDTLEAAKKVRRSHRAFLVLGVLMLFLLLGATGAVVYRFFFE